MSNWTRFFIPQTQNVFLFNRIHNLKDWDNKGQRIYNEHQIERSRFIHQELQRQKEQGINRMDIEEMNAKLLDEFGGEITTIEKREMFSFPGIDEKTAKLILNLSRKVFELEEQLASKMSSLEEEISTMNQKTDQILLNQEAEKKRIEQRDHALMESLNKTLEERKEEVTATKESNWFKKLLKNK